MQDLPRHRLPRALLYRLNQILPEDGLLTEPEELRPYECDGLSAYRRLPAAVTLPRTNEQVREIVLACREHGTPVIARGAGTGLSGGALPREDAVILSLARLNRILTIDPDNGIAVVQPGVRNLAVSQAARPHGLFYAPDPSSQIACTIGGNVAENSGGVHCLKYGLTVHNLRGLKILTSDGEILELGGAALDTPGPGLIPLFTGSEGLLGIVLEITLRLLPLPPAAAVMLLAFDDVESAALTVADIIGSGLVPAGLELMDKLATAAAEDFAHAGYPRDAGAVLLCELDGSKADVTAQLERVEAIAHARGSRETQIAHDEAGRQRLWAGRKAAFPAAGRLAPDYYCMDGTIPRHRLPEVLARIEVLSRRYRLGVVNVFHAGDGNLHPLILYDANQEGELERAEAMGTEILQACVEAGGTITGEHGVGVEKLDAMCHQFATPELTQFHAVKAALDPFELLNPGKGIPTLHRCAELGGMHIHGGRLPHPELERF